MHVKLETIMPTKIRVLKDHVAIKEIKEPEKTKSGIYIPDSAKNKPMKGEVVAIGPGVYDKKGNRKAPNFALGDVIVYSRGSGQLLTISDTEEYNVLKPEDILAKLR